MGRKKNSNSLSSAGRLNRICWETWFCFWCCAGWRCFKWWSEYLERLKPTSQGPTCWFYGFMIFLFYLNFLFSFVGVLWECGAHSSSDFSENESNMLCIWPNRQVLKLIYLKNMLCLYHFFWNHASFSYIVCSKFRD